MSNDLTAFLGDAAGGLPTKNIAESLRQSSLDRDTTNRFVESLEGRELLSFASRTQKWVFGKEKEPLGDDKLAVNPSSFVHGLCCWTGGNNSTFVDEIMVPITEPVPEPPAEWAAKGDTTKQFQVDLQILEGEYLGVPLRFRSNSYGGVASVQDLAGKVADRLEQDHNGYFIPVVVLDYSTYSHSTWGQLGNPIFKVVDWANAQGEMWSAADAPAQVEDDSSTGPAADKEPPKKRRRAS